MDLFLPKLLRIEILTNENPHTHMFGIKTGSLSSLYKSFSYLQSEARYRYLFIYIIYIIAIQHIGAAYWIDIYNLLEIKDLKIIQVIPMVILGLYIYFI